MSYSFDNDVALSVLRKYDPQCHIILDTCNKVKIYNFDKITNSWIIQNQSEGAFYLVKRVIPPLYKFVILSKYNNPGSFPLTTDIHISAYDITRSHQNFYMFKNELGVIQSIMFPCKDDCDRIYNKVNMIINDLKLIAQTIMLGSPNLKTNSSVLLEKEHDSSDNKILSLLESAKQRYNKVHNDSRENSRQININELFPSNIKAGPVAADKNVNSSKIVQSPIDKHDNSNSTLTVTELEKLFVQCSSKVIYDEEDDSQLLDPVKLTATVSLNNKEDGNGLLLSKTNLKDALIHMLQNDDDGDFFLTKLHSAYLDLCQKRSGSRY